VKDEKKKRAATSLPPLGFERKKEKNLGKERVSQTNSSFLLPRAARSGERRRE